MSKVSKKLGVYFCVFIGIILLLYTCLWFIAAVKITNNINSNFAGRSLNINETNHIAFSKATFSGYPFKLQISLHNLAEKSPSTLINHESKFDIGYNFITQRLYSSYDGKSMIHNLPMESGFGAKVEGKYIIQATIPTQRALFKAVFSGFNYFDILHKINDVTVKAENVRAWDKVDNSLIVDQSNTFFNLKATHHRKYRSFEEFKTDIPKSLSLKLKTSSKDTSAVFRKPLPFSLVYGTHWGSNAGYEADMVFETKAHNLDAEEIFSNLKIIANKINFYDSYFTSKGQFEYIKTPPKDMVDSSTLNYKSEIFIADSFVKDIDQNIKSFTKDIPQNSTARYYVNWLDKYDITKLAINTKNSPIKLDVESSIIDNKATKKITLDVEKFTILYKDKSVDLKLKISNDFKNDPITGIIQTRNIIDIIEYFVSNYYAISKEKDEEFSEDFWSSLYLDYLETIANSVNREQENVLVEFTITDKIDQSKLGKYDLAQGRIIYYQKLFKHLTTYYQNKDEAIKYLRFNSPEYITEPKVFEKITGVK